MEGRGITMEGERVGKGVRNVIEEGERVIRKDGT